MVDNPHPPFHGLETPLRSNWVKHLQRQAAELLLYQSVFDNQVGKSFWALLAALVVDDAPPLKAGRSQTLSTHPDSTDAAVWGLTAYGQLFRALAAAQQSWQSYLIEQILYADHPFSQQVQRRDLADLPPELLAAARHDLQILQQLWHWNGQGLVTALSPLATATLPSLPEFRPSEQANPFAGYNHWAEALPALAGYHHQFGCGAMARYRAFVWQGGKLQGQSHPDPVTMDELVGYELQRDQLLQNTEALLQGYPALNILLYGSRGSGKSAMIKALLPLYGDRGLRLIEVSKAALIELPLILARLHDLPQKFIIFVDDLSFAEEEDSYKALKVVLEGNLTPRPAHVVVYATSNRRHLIREFFQDRPAPAQGDEVHAWDTVQEKLSLSDRFGLTLTFAPIDQDQYLQIVNHLAARAGICLAEADLQFRALQWATRQNGRSGRTARQFVDFLRSELAQPS